MTGIYYSLVTNPSSDRFILTTTNYQYSRPKSKKQQLYHPLLYTPQYSHLLPPNLTRQQTQLGTDDYKRSLRRSFARAKFLAFFNSDLTHFVTLTYKGINHTPDDVQKDIKLLIKKQKRTTTKKLKYIYVMEYQKRGSIHVHMICNDWFDYVSLRNKKLSVKLWDKGFSDVKTIQSFDDNFKPYLYLFKYMHKAQRIGKSFIHTSRNIDKSVSKDYREYIDKLKRSNSFYKEDYEFVLNGKTARITKEYYKAPSENVVAKEKRL